MEKIPQYLFTITHKQPALLSCAIDKNDDFAEGNRVCNVKGNP